MDKARETLVERRPTNEILAAHLPELLSPEEKLIWLLGDLMNAAENFFGYENPKRLGHINSSAIRILDEIVDPLRADLTRLNAKVEELKARAELLEQERDEARDMPWPQWAAELVKYLRSFGVDPGDGGWDLPRDFEDWMAGVVETETRRAEKAEARLARAVEVMRPFAEAANHFVVPRGKGVMFLESESGRLRVKAAWFRRARAFLSEQENRHGNG